MVYDPNETDSRGPGNFEFSSMVYFHNIFLSKGMVTSMNSIPNEHIRLSALP